MQNIVSRIAALVAWWQSRSTDSMLLLGLDLPTSIGPEIGTDNADIARRLASMPLFVREVYLLRAVDRMSIRDISVRLAISPSKTRRHLRHAITMLAAKPVE